MTRVVIHIKRLFVHGAQPFETQAFSSALTEAVRHQLGDGLNADNVAQRFATGSAPQLRAAPSPRPALLAHTGESLAATHVAERIVRRG